MFFFKKKANFTHQFITVLIAAMALAFLVRGAWGLTDTYLFPEDPTLSYLVSFFFGLVVLYVEEKRLLSAE